VRLDGNVAVVTGGAQGLGRAMVRSLVAEGASVVIADLQPDKAAALAAELGERALALTLDVADPASSRALVAGTLAHFGRIDCLVNNAALFSTLTLKPFEEIDAQEWRRVIDVNLSGPFFCAQAVAGPMRAQQSGRIINISSNTVLIGRAHYAHYVSSKAGVVGLTRALARELGDAGITVNAIMPGMTITEVPRATISPAIAAQALAAQALPRPNEPEDIAAAVVFLASADARQITGQTLVVDGGFQFI
jgi:3-oxoacyl-[acyl-carrier protein] reductase